MEGIRHWRGGSPDTNVVLVEGRGIQLTLDDIPLNPLLLKYPKYPVLLLAANMARCLGGRTPAIVDLKHYDSPTPPRVETYRRLEYEGRDLSFSEVGDDDEALLGQLRGAEIVCVSCNYTMERAAACRLLSEIRRIRPRALVIVGGHDATVVPTPYLTAGADLCILGEGETVLRDILQARCADELRGIRGTAHWSDSGVKRTGRRPVHDLDCIQYPGRIALMESSNAEYPDGPWPDGVGPRFTVLETSRGCNEGCNFCSSTFVSGRFRTWSLDGMLAQVARIRRAGVRTLLIADDNLLYRVLPGHGGEQGRADLLALFSSLRANGFSWTFYNGLQFGLLEAGGVIDHELIAALFSSEWADGRLVGCFEAYIPLERFDAAEAALLPKLRPREIQRELIRAISAERVHQLNLGFIIGTPRDSQEILDLAFEHAADFADLIVGTSGGTSRVRHLPWCSVPLPGTPNRSRYKEATRYDLDAFPELNSNYVSVIEGIGATPYEFTIGRRSLDDALNARTNPSSVASAVRA